MRAPRTSGRCEVVRARACGRGTDLHRIRWWEAPFQDAGGSSYRGAWRAQPSYSYCIFRCCKALVTQGTTLKSQPNATVQKTYTEDSLRSARHVFSQRASIHRAVREGDPRRAARHLARIARRARSHYRRETIGTNVAVFLSLATRAHRDSVLTLERDSRDRAGC